MRSAGTVTTPAATRVLGIDPAPSKETWIYTDESTFLAKRPGDLSDYLREELRTHGDMLISWDAPLSFDPSKGFSDRPVDKLVRSAVKGHPKIEPSAVNSLPFSGCPHWAISSHVLGYPIGPAKLGLRLVESPAPGRCLVEVHPAVALAVWWILFDCAGEFPKYKGLKGGRAARRAVLSRIADGLAQLDPPESVRDSDDHLDAWVAWKLGHSFLAGDAELLGSVEAGSYLLPRGAQDALGL